MQRASLSAWAAASLDCSQAIMENSTEKSCIGQDTTECSRCGWGRRDVLARVGAMTTCLKSRRMNLGAAAKAAASRSRVVSAKSSDPAFCAALIMLSSRLASSPATSALAMAITCPAACKLARCQHGVLYWAASRSIVEGQPWYDCALMHLDSLILQIFNELFVLHLLLSELLMVPRLRRVAHFYDLTLLLSRQLAWLTWRVRARSCWRACLPEQLMIACLESA